MELVLAIAIFGMGSIVAGRLLIDANISTRVDIDKAEAISIAREGIEAVTAIRDSSFENLVQSSWPRGLALGLGGSGWAFSSLASDIKDKFDRSITVTLDPASSFTSTSTATVVCNVTWTSARNVQDSVSLTTVLTDWKQPGI